jgi:hypothetical protein
MPYFLCPVCALRAYTAAPESRCPSCDAPLRRADQLHPSIPRAEPLGERGARSATEDSGRFRTAARSGIPEGGIE